MPKNEAKRRRKWRRSRRRTICYSPLNRFAPTARGLLVFEQLEDRRLLSSTPYSQIASDLRNELNNTQSGLTSILASYKTGATSSIPFAGNQIGGAAQFVTLLQGALTTLSTTSTSTDVQTAFSQALGSYLVNDNDTAAGPADVHFTPVGTDGGFKASMRLHLGVGSTVNFNIGLPGLPLSVNNAGVAVGGYVDFELGLVYTASGNNPHTLLDATKTLTGSLPGSGHELVFSVSAYLPSNFSGTARLGFVQGTLTPVAGQANSLSVFATADQLDSAPTIGSLTFTADANLQLTGGFGNSTNGIGADKDFPSVGAQVHLHWAFPSETAPEIAFDNVGLNLGQFINNTVGPVLDGFQKATGPLNGVIDVLNKPLPVLSDLSNAIGDGDVSLMSLAKVAAPFAGLGPLASLISTVATVIHDFDSFPLSSGTIPLGGFNLNGQNVQNDNVLGDATADPSVNNSNLTSLLVGGISAGESFGQAISGLPDSVKSGLNSLTAGLSNLTSNGRNSFDIEFPVFTDPADAVFKMLLGEDAPLFTLSALMNLDAAENSGLDVLGMGLSFSGAIHLGAQVTLGYDTYGLREILHQAATNTLTSNSIATDIIDGFYIDDHSHFDFGGTIGITAGASIGIAAANVEGYLGTGINGANNTPIGVAINDPAHPNHDGKLRLGSLLNHPLDAFTTHGQLDAGLTFEIEVGVHLPFAGFVGYSTNFDIAHAVVFSFDSQPTPPAVILASPANGPGSPVDGSGVVELFVGKEAIRRLGVDDTDGGPNGTGESYVIKHVEDDSTGETIEIDAFGKSQTITGVETIWANGDIGDLTIDVEPGVKADVVFNRAPDPLDSTYTGPYTNQGHAYLRYSGTGMATLTAGQLSSSITGGKGSNYLHGGSGGDAFVTGAGLNTVYDSVGDNIIFFEEPTKGLTLSSSSTAYNTLEVVATKTTTAISATPSGSSLVLQTQDSSGASTYDTLPYISQLIVDAQANAVPITIGNLRGLAQQFLAEVYEPASAVGNRSVTLDTPASSNGSPTSMSLVGATELDPDPQNTNQKVIRYGIAVIEDSIGGVGVALFGLTAADTLTVKEHGGTTDISDLGFNGGTIILDDSSNQSGFSESTTLTTPIRTGGSTIVTNGYGPIGSGGFRIQAAGDPDIVVKGMTTFDSVTVKVSAAPTGMTNRVTVDASSLIGALHIDALGSSFALNNILVSAVSEHGTVSIDGENTVDNVTVGDGDLFWILGNVSVARSVLTIDDSASTSANIFTFAGGTLAGWDTGLFITPPTLTFINLQYILTFKAGAGDQFDLEFTPANIVELNIKNFTATRDSVYVAGASTHLVFDGDFRLSLGEHISPTGIVSAASTLVPLANTTVAFNFSSSFYAFFSPTLVKFADPSATGSSYTIGGNGNLVVTNQTYGVTVTINDFRGQDGVLLDLAGGTVSADLTNTGAGTITLDGSARLSGTNVSAANNVLIHARAGAVVMLPTGDNDNKVAMFNTFYVLGSRPQDNLDVYDYQNNIAIGNDAIPAAYAKFAAAFGDSTTVTAGQPFDFTILAQDANGVTLTTYTNQVQWYAYNQATGDYFSSNYEPFISADQGRHVFYGLVLTNPGTYSLGFDDGWNASAFTIVAVASGQGSVYGQSVAIAAGASKTREIATQSAVVTSDTTAATTPVATSAPTATVAKESPATTSEAALSGNVVWSEDVVNTVVESRKSYRAIASSTPPSQIGRPSFRPSSSVRTDAVDKCFEHFHRRARFESRSGGADELRHFDFPFQGVINTRFKTFCGSA